MHCLPLRWEFSKNIAPEDNGVFTSCSKNGICFHRNHFRNIFIDAYHNGTEITKWAKGEDPRVFEKDNHLYLVSNYLNRMKLFKLNGTTILQQWKLPFRGKNIMPIDTTDKMFEFLDIQEKQIYSMMLLNDSGVIYKRSPLKMIVGRNPHCPMTLNDCVLRGGTSGIKHCGGFMGAGHCTFCPGRRMQQHMSTGKACHHKPFLWYTRDLGTVTAFPLCLSSKNIIDPTTILENKLLTSESDDWWFTPKQKFANVEYRAV